jgi:hypothetical protein
MYWFHQFMQLNGVKPQDVGCGSAWSAACQLINRTQATTLPLRKRLYWTLRFPSWYTSRSWHNATLAMQAAFTKDISIFVNWNSWQGRFYQPAGSAKAPDAGTGASDWWEFAREQAMPLLWTEDWFGP